MSVAEEVKEKLTESNLRELYPTMARELTWWEFTKMKWSVWRQKRKIQKTLAKRQKPIYSDCFCLCRNWSWKDGEVLHHSRGPCLCYCSLHDCQQPNSDGTPRPNKLAGVEVAYRRAVD